MGIEKIERSEETGEVVEKVDPFFCICCAHKAKDQEGLDIHLQRPSHIDRHEQWEIEGKL